MLFVCLSLAILTVCTSPQSEGASSDRKILGEERWVTSISAADGKPLRIYVWEKRLKETDIKAYSANGKVAVLAHGSSIPSRVIFYLQVPGHFDLTYSLMDYLAERGFDIFAVEYQNYGHRINTTVDDV